MKRTKYLIILLLIACTGALAQTTQGVTIGLSIAGPIFIVDGQQYASQQIFFWPVGSKHILQFLLSVDEASGNTLPFQAANGDIARWTFGGWTDNLGNASQGGVIETVTVVPGLTSIFGTVTPLYRLTVQFYGEQTSDGFTCGAPGNAPSTGFSYGIVYVDGQCISNTTDIWTSAGTHTLAAYPFPGWGFAGWIVDGGLPNAFLSSFTMTSSTRIIPQFLPAKRVKFRTNPLGLQVVVDHSVITTPPSAPTSLLPSTNIDSNCQPDYSRLPPNPPANVAPLCIGDFDFLPGSAHQIGAPSPQMDAAGKYWVFSAFSDGLTQNSSYVTDTLINQVDLVYANFVPGVQATFTTVPNGLSLQIDGRSNWPAYNFVWGQGETHHIVAPPTQTDSKGRVWQFVSWSNQGAAAQDITVPNGVPSIGLTATYQILGQVQITSAPSGLSLTVDGAPCVTPCIVNHTAGTKMDVLSPSSIPSGPASRYDFDSWSAGGKGPALQVTFDQNVQTFTANFHASYLLTAAAKPSAGATFKLNPPSPDGYFAEGTSVSVMPVVSGGYKFVRWEGDLSGGLSPGYLTMTSPRTVVADLVAVPFITPAGITNAAGNTPDGSVAPGSIISIYGQNLADSLQLGPVNPLAQTIGNVTVTVGDYLMPLFFVSPSQINAQVPSELADGTYTLTVHTMGQADISAPFTVKRDSPGVFTQFNEQKIPYVLALHQDGTVVTADSPARHGEVISVYGTGFGPYDQPVIDGFPAPQTPLRNVADPVMVTAGTLKAKPDFAGAAPGFVGLTQLNLKITDDFPSGVVVDMAVTVNGVSSNTVKLPLE